MEPIQPIQTACPLCVEHFIDERAGLLYKYNH